MTWRERSGTRVAITSMVLMMMGSVLAPSAAAEAVDQLRAAVDASRTTACSPLQDNPLVDQAAAEINESNNKWLNFAGRAVPVPDALPLLKDLGYPGDKGVALYGAGKDEGSAIKALILQGFRALPDCSYKDVGVNMVYGSGEGWILATVVLAG